MEVSSAPADAFAIVTIKAKSERTQRYTVPAALRPKLDDWNSLPADGWLRALRSVPARDVYRVDDLRR
jgi:hypothetical protein